MPSLLAFVSALAFFCVATHGPPLLRLSAPPGIDSVVRLSSDGWELIGTLTLPPHASPPSPAVLLLNQAAGNRRAYEALAADLVRHGVASLRLDLRGHGESVNRGRFTPGLAGSERMLLATDHDITAGLKFLAAQPGIAVGRLGVVGASYSSEFAVRAARDGGPPVAAFAFLSPGSLSPGSIAWLESAARPWLFIASRQERAPSTREVIQLVADSTHWADIMLVAPAGHATTLLEVVPALSPILAAWLADHLGAGRSTLSLPAN